MDYDVCAAYTLLVESFDVDLAGRYLPHVIAAAAPRTDGVGWGLAFAAVVISVSRADLEDVAATLVALLEQAAARLPPKPAPITGKPRRPPPPPVAEAEVEAANEEDETKAEAEVDAGEAEVEAAKEEDEKKSREFRLWLRATK
ncbi:hypothetical protein T484DRAFT_1764926 [Baffinella frigidus]|nr:hypothetical protein T484DRAFT_1764926 [Cryptophyta sp. CCMP2293]